LRLKVQHSIATLFERVGEEAAAPLSPFPSPSFLLLRRRRLDDDDSTTTTRRRRLDDDDFARWCEK
jgi:hypothetical protein